MPKVGSQRKQRQCALSGGRGREGLDLLGRPGGLPHAVPQNRGSFDVDLEGVGAGDHVVEGDGGLFDGGFGSSYYASVGSPAGLHYV